MSRHLEVRLSVAASAVGGMRGFYEFCKRPVRLEIDGKEVEGTITEAEFEDRADYPDTIVNLTVRYVQPVPLDYVTFELTLPVDMGGQRELFKDYGYGGGDDGQGTLFEDS